MSSNFARKTARRKHQTRLTFDPIDPDPRSSSPATNLSPANVRYHLPVQRNTPSSSRTTYTLEEEEESEDPLSATKKTSMAKSARGKAKAKDTRLPFKALPTPVKSSQTMAKGGAAFAKEISIGEMSEDELEGNKIRAERRLSMGLTLGGAARKKGSRPNIDLDESDGSLPEDEVETPSKSKKGKRKIASWISEDDVEMEETLALPQQLGRLSTTPKLHSTTKSRREKSVTLSSGSDDVSPPLKHSRKRKSSRPQKQVQAEGEDDDTDDIPIASSSRQRWKVADESVTDLPIAPKLMRYPTSTSPANGTPKDQAVSVEDSEDEDIVMSSVYKRQPRQSAQEDEETDEDPISSPLKKRGRPLAMDSEDSDIRSSPRKRRKPTANEEDDDSDLPSVNDIRSRKGPSSSSGTIPTRITRQAKGRKHRTDREKKMELLKRKRAGEDIDELTDSEASSEPNRGIYDSDSDSDREILEVFDDESEPEAVPKSKAKNRTPDVNHYDSDFVVQDDEDAPLGVPLGLSDIPLEFTHAAHKPMKEHFKDAIEWMVHRKVNPAFLRNDGIYLQAFTKLDDEYMGYAKSKFVSTQWTAEFTRAIYARPILIERPCGPGEGYSVDGVPKCDVCNHRKHFPKFALHFEGKAYHKATLEEVEQGSEYSDSDSGSDEAVSVNSNGHSLPAEDKEWFSGIICRDNAQQAHALIHWKFALNEWVVDQLENEGYLSPEKLAEREKMKARKRRDFANELVDRWEGAGIIKSLYRDFKGQLEAARESKQGRWEKGTFKGFGGGGYD